MPAVRINESGREMSHLEDLFLRHVRAAGLPEPERERWGDEWWTTNQVAAHYGVHISDVLRLIKRGEIRGVQA